MKKFINIFVVILILSLMVNPALALGEATQRTNTGLKTYEIEIYGVPTKVIIAENSVLKTPEEIKTFIERHVGREEFLNGVIVDVSEVFLEKPAQSRMTKEYSTQNFLRGTPNELAGAGLSFGVLEVLSIGSFILTGPYALFAMAIITAAIIAVYKLYGDEISDEIREKLDSAYQYFYNYIEERKKDEKTIHIYEKDFYGGLPKRIYVKEFVHKKILELPLGNWLVLLLRFLQANLLLTPL